MAIDDLRNRDWVLLPGTLCTGDIFSEFLDVLGVPENRRTTVSMGYATVEAYGETLTRQANETVFCGFSLGALVAAHHADRLAACRMILFGLNPFPDDPEKSEGRHALARDVQALGGATALRSRLAPMSGSNPERARALVLAMADAAAPDIEAQTNLALSRPGALKALSQSQSPVLVLTGSDDALAPPMQGQAAADMAPSGRFSLLPNLGHYALIEDPAACAQAVIGMEDTYQ